MTIITDANNVYTLVNQLDGTFQILDSEDMDIIGEYVTLNMVLDAILDYEAL